MVIDFDVSASNYYNITESTFVAPGVYVEAPDIYITDSLLLDNAGTIIGNINVCQKCQLDIINSGELNVVFSVADGAIVNQIISNKAHMVSIDLDSGLNLTVQDMPDAVSFTDILNVSGDADVITFRNTNVIWDSPGFITSNVKFEENVVLRVTDSMKIIGVPLIDNVSVVGNLTIDADINNPMFEVVPCVDNGTMYLGLVRQTDYTKFMDYDVGYFINSLRYDAYADSFIDALDGAQSVDVINEIMAESVRMSPINMMDVVRVFNMFDANDFGNDLGVGATYILGDDFNLYGGGLIGRFGLTDLEIGASMYLNLFDATDKYDEYNGKMFGAKIYTKYNFDNMLFRGLIGGNITKFNLDNIFDGKTSVNNPDGKSIYGSMDLLYKFYDDNSVYAFGYAGTYYGWASILENKVTDNFGRFGAEVGYTHEIMGLRYNYSLNFGVTTDVDLMFGVRARYQSVIDSIGAHASIDFIDNKIGRGYKIAAGIDFKF